MIVTQVAERFGINQYCLYARLNRGMSIEDAISKPVKKLRKH